MLLLWRLLTGRIVVKICQRSVRITQKFAHSVKSSGGICRRHFSGRSSSRFCKFRSYFVAHRRLPVLFLDGFQLRSKRQVRRRRGALIGRVVRLTSVVLGRIAVDQRVEVVVAVVKPVGRPQDEGSWTGVVVVVRRGRQGEQFVVVVHAAVGRNVRNWNVEFVVEVHEQAGLVTASDPPSFWNKIIKCFLQIYFAWKTFQLFNKLFKFWMALTRIKERSAFNIS